MKTTGEKILALLAVMFMMVQLGLVPYKGDLFMLLLFLGISLAPLVVVGLVELVVKKVYNDALSMSSASMLQPGDRVELLDNVSGVPAHTLGTVQRIERESRGVRRKITIRVRWDGSGCVLSLEVGKHRFRQRERQAA